MNSNKKRMKYLLFTALIYLLISCTNQKLKDKNVFNKEVMGDVTEVASLGKFKKIEYKFIEPSEKEKGKIEITLSNGVMSDVNYNELELAIKTSKAFLNKFEDTDQYDYIVVRMTGSVKGEKDSLLKEKTYTFLTSKLR